MSKKNTFSYISLFSGAGVGCYGFKLEKFDCISTVEILEKRLNIQKNNNKCLFESGYLCGDIREENVKESLRNNINFFLKNSKSKDIDVLIATPPCQGISVANHKKQNEKRRNSLVVESIKLIKEFAPKIFIFENVRSFLNTICTDIDGNDKKILEAIDQNLFGSYNILYKVVNFKNYGSNSSRTRTLVIGVRKDQKNMTPFDLFPEYKQEKTLYEVIGDLPELKIMGEISETDIYHQFKPYSEYMRYWITGIKEGESAFDNKDLNKRPHKIINGEIIENKNKNGDKYKRQVFKKVAPCIHTRNDILSSQNTIHPKDDRVFSIRELMNMMTIPKSFNWSNYDNKYLNNLSFNEKKSFLKKEEMNIRHSIGEAVPTFIFQQIATKIKNKLIEKEISSKKIEFLINNYNLNDFDNLKKFIEKNTLNLSYESLLRISEFSNSKRVKNSAYYTSQDIVFSIVKNLPDSKNYKNISILEPSVGIGSFLPLLIQKYKDVQSVNIDVVDIDKNSIKLLSILLKKIKVPKNIKINFINADFLTYEFNQKYNIVIGNPPFGKITNNKKILSSYLNNVSNKKTNNIFSFFIEKSIKIGSTVSLIVPKSILNSPEFNETRDIINTYQIKNLLDFGEKGFNGIKIETINFLLNSTKKATNNVVKIESYITKEISLKYQKYITDKQYPYWLIYRNEYFDEIAEKMIFDIFTAFRDRKITKKHTKSKGKIRVLKSRNIASNKIINIENYDCYIDEIDFFSVKKYFNKDNLVLVPNLSYKPRACFLPKNCITDGSVAILELKENNIKISEEDLEYYNTQEFAKFYLIARNLGTRTLNIDNNSVFYFGRLKK